MALGRYYPGVPKSLNIFHTYYSPQVQLFWGIFANFWRALVFMFLYFLRTIPQIKLFTNVLAVTIRFTSLKNLFATSPALLEAMFS